MQFLKTYTFPKANCHFYVKENQYINMYACWYCIGVNLYIKNILVHYKKICVWNILFISSLYACVLNAIVAFAYLYWQFCVIVHKQWHLSDLDHILLNLFIYFIIYLFIFFIFNWHLYLKTLSEILLLKVYL